jgi:hypothetical protein
VKNYFVHLIVFGGLVLLLAGATLAQTVEIEPAARANIPFEFYAGSTSLPAGAYTFDLDPVAHVVTVEQSSTGHALYLIGMPADLAETGKTLLMFEKQGDEYRLMELRTDVGSVEFTLTNVGTSETPETSETPGMR